MLGYVVSTVWCIEPATWTRIYGNREAGLHTIVLPTNDFYPYRRSLAFYERQFSVVGVACQALYTDCLKVPPGAAHYTALLT